jgi:bis(5'-nucleosyl)-tetraphosphatase (symmetrical)
MSTFVIGDIQGCYQEFRALLERAGFDARTDALWLVGDLINRGPDNIAVMDYVMSLPTVHTVLGNHDLHFLAAASGVRKPSRSDTLNDLLTSPRCREIVEWLRQQPLIYHDPERLVTMVHAGLPPMWDISTCIARAREVETWLRGPRFEEFLQQMYGNQPDEWDDQLDHMPRLRLITNYFTRMRYCSAQGKLELTHKTNLKPDGYDPWFHFREPEGAGAKVLFGHWATLEGMTGKPSMIALDTGCVWGRHLTALRLDDGVRFTVNSTLPQKSDD